MYRKLIGIFLVMLMFGNPGIAYADIIAVAVTGAPIDLTQSTKVEAAIKRVAATEVRNSIEKVISGTFSLGKDSNGNPVGKVTWDELTSADGAQRVPISPPPVTLIDVRSGQIAGAAELAIDGKLSALSRAAETLLEQIRAAAADSGEKEEDDDVGDVGEADGGGTAGSGSQAFENDLATLPALNVTEAEPVTETVTVQSDVFGSTTTGCDPVFDEAANVMIITEAATTNGEVTGACEEGVRILEIKETYVGCGYDIDVAALKASPKRRRYYVNGGNTTYLDSTCTIDTTVEYTIEEAIGNCGLINNFAIDKVQQSTTLSFRGATNEVVEADACKVRASATGFPIEYVADDCSLADYFESDGSGKSVVREQPSYLGGDGLRRPLGVCAETEKFYLHIKDVSVCDTFADIAASKLYSQYKIRIDTPEGSEFRTQNCQLDDTALTDLQKTGTGCESLHFDYSGYSHGAERIIRKDNGEQVRSCEEAEIVYTHQTLAQGWLPDDANLQALPKEALFITLPEPAGDTIVEPAIVRASAVAVAYTFVNNGESVGTVSYVEGSCDSFTETLLTANYTRPDQSPYAAPNGSGTPVGPKNACTTVLTADWPLTGVSGGLQNPCNTGRTSPRGKPVLSARWFNAGTYTGSRVITRVDGVVISNDAATNGLTVYGTCTGSTPAAPANASFAGISTSNAWMVSLGWK